MSHLNVMQSLSVSSDIVRVSELVNEFRWSAVTPLGGVHLAEAVTMTYEKGFLSVKVNDAGAAAVTICKTMTYEEMCDMAEVLRSGFEAYVKLYGVMFCEWADDFDVAAWNGDVLDALYVLRDNISMYLNPPVEPVSAHNEGDYKSSIQAGAYEAEQELMGEYFAPVGSVISDDEWLAAARKDGVNLDEYMRKEKTVVAIVDVCRDSLDSLRLQYSFWVEKQGELSTNEFMDMVLEYMEGGE